MRMADPRPFGETSLRAIVRAICDADPENVRDGGCVESVLTVLTQRRPGRCVAMTWTPEASARCNADARATDEMSLFVGGAASHFGPADAVTSHSGPSRCSRQAFQRRRSCHALSESVTALRGPVSAWRKPSRVVRLHDGVPDSQFDGSCGVVA